MKKIISALLLLAAPIVASAQNEAASFLSLTADPRNAAMGSLGASLSSDAYAVFSGSAAGAFASERFSVAASHTYAGENGRTLWAGAGYVAFGKAGTLTVGFRRYGGKSVQGYDDGGNATERFSPHDMAAEAGYAIRLHSKWSLGLTARYVSSAIWSDISAAAFGADLQAMFRTETGKRGGDLRISAGLRNVGTKLSFDGGTKTAMPGAAGIDAAMKIPLDGRKRHTLSWTAGAQIKIAGDKGFAAAAGAEYFLFDMVGVRCGYHMESDDRKFGYGKEAKNDLNYATLGAALKYRFIRADFAYMIGTEECPVNGVWCAGVSILF